MSPVHVGADAVQVVCVDVGVPQALPDAQVGVNLVSTSGSPLGPPPVQVVGLSGQLVTVGVMPQMPAPVQFGAYVVSEPELQLSAWSGQAVSVGVPPLTQPLPAVLHAAVKLRLVGTRAPETQMSAPAVQAVVLELTSQPPGSAQVGVLVVS